MTRRLLLSLSPGEIWAAATEDGELAALRLVRTYGAARTGDVYLGRVVALRPELPAALVDIGEARPGFLGGEDAPPGAKLHEGDAIVVKVTKAARADKAAGLTAKLDAAEQRLAASGKPPKLLHRREPALVSLLREFANVDEAVVDDAAALAEAKRAAVSPVRLHRETTPLFTAEGIDAAVQSALAPLVALRDGGAITIEPTAAATLIDIDGGPRGAVPANLAAAGEIARQIRLRDLSGPIVIDFIGMKERGQRLRVEASLKKAMGDVPNYLGWTRLGHFELTIPRRRPALTEQLYEYRPGDACRKTPLTVALEALRACARESRVSPAARFELHVHPEVAACLDRAAAGARQELEERLGYTVRIAVESGPRDSFAVVPAVPILSNHERART